MRLIVGLGNPGREYVGTRHNVGWELVDALAQRLGWIAAPADFERSARTKFNGLALDGNCTLPSGRTEKLLLLKPMTYMNLSGQSVQAAMGFYQLKPEEALVVLDDLALPCGKIRLRASGSSGGHNGLKDIERALGSSDYPRLRIGIDPPPPRVPQKDYVLGRFSEAQRAALGSALVRGVDATLLWVEKGMTAAMNQFNAADRASPSAADRASPSADDRNEKQNGSSSAPQRITDHGQRTTKI
jgi:PTH1 family peptidyl-tRNA hydrolase